MAIVKGMAQSLTVFIECATDSVAVICRIKTDTLHNTMKFISLLLLSMFELWSLVEVHSQTEYPYVSFMGETLPNHAYVDLSLVGSDGSGSDSVQCHTDLTTCCTGSQGSDRGDRFSW